ncbi:MAG: hypothetical protein OXC37_02455 [Bdellovibrionaceae bacterium]|nr:hypothetical protein [Pseudobdellovibrionaceae bacterium]
MNFSKGMTLLEMLLSLGIFTFMFIFITQTVKQSRRYAQKVKQDIDKRSSFDYVSELIKKDFNSASFLFDLNDNFRKNFPVRKNLEEQINSFSNLSDEERETDKQPEKSVKNLPVFMSPYFTFTGEEDKLEFVSYSITQSVDNNIESLNQWIQVIYFVEACPSLKSSSCLMRASKKYWNLEEEPQEEEKLVLFRDFNSLKFSYLSGLNLGDSEWEDSWKVERRLSFFESSVAYPQELPFPFRVKLEIETNKINQTEIFNVSNPYLRSWNPFSKEFFNFSKWKPPKKKPKTKKRSQTKKTSKEIKKK